MKVMNLLTSGETGGIESLCRDIGQYAEFENIFCFLTAGGQICDQMKSMNMDVKEVYKKGSKFSISKLNVLIDLAKECDVITVHHGDPFLKLYFVLLKYMTKKKMVSIIHSCYDDVHFKGYGKWKRILTDAIFKKSLKISDKIVYVSKAGKNTYEKHFGIDRNEKARVIYNGISPYLIELGKNNYYSDTKPYNITYIGRLSEIKGLKYLLEAIKKVSTKWDIKLTIVGDGNYRSSLENQSRNLGIDHLVSFENQQINIIPYLEKASLFIYPSTCMEVFGISIVEAMAYGVPCIGSNIGGIPEIIVDNMNGWLSKPGNSDDLAKKIDMVLHKIKNGELQKNIDEERKTAQMFSILNTVNRLKQEYEG